MSRSKRETERQLKVKNGMARLLKAEEESHSPLLRFSNIAKKAGKNLANEFQDEAEDFLLANHEAAQEFSQTLEDAVSDVRKNVMRGLSEIGLIERSPLDKAWRQTEKAFKPLLDTARELSGNASRRLDLDKLLGNLHRDMNKAGEKLYTFMEKCTSKLKEVLKPLLRLWSRLTDTCQQLWEKATRINKQQARLLNN